MSVSQIFWLIIHYLSKKDEIIRDYFLAIVTKTGLFYFCLCVFMGLSQNNMAGFC